MKNIKKLLFIALISVSACNLHACEPQVTVDTSTEGKKSAEEINSPKNIKALFDAIAKHDSCNVQGLLARGINPNVKIDQEGGFPLFYAVYYKDISIVDLLLKYGADINLQNNDGKTSLMRAAYDANLGMVQLLLSREAKVNLQNASGNTALMDTIINPNEASDKKLSCIAELLRHNAEPNLQNSIGHTFLIRAVYSGRQDIVEFLLNQDNRKLINTDLQDGTSKTALMWAVENGNIDMARILLDANVDVDIRDYRGRTAMDIAICMQNKFKEDYRNNNRNTSIGICQSMIDMLEFHKTTVEISLGIPNMPVNLCSNIASYSGHDVTI